jgi:flagellar hook-associated protein 1 FlgK
MSLISIGLSGLTASSAAINTIGNNTANVDTAGYSRQQVMTTASAQQNIGIGIGYIGTGTTLSDVRRIYNSYLDSQLQSTTALGADATAYSAQASKTDSLLSDTSTGIANTLATFFSQMQAVGTSATDSNARSQFLTTAQALTARLNSMSSQLSDQNSTINTQLTDQVNQINSLASSIASLNKQITASSAGGTNPNSLLDARNEAVRSLNELVGAKVVENNGNYDVYVGNGQSLVSGTTSFQMSTGPSSDDSTQFAVKISYGAGNTTDVTSVVSGGSMGGLLRYRSDVLTPAVNQLGQVALALSDTVNTQLQQGVDANGEFGTALFKSINDPSMISQRSIGKVGNTAGSSNLNVNISDTSKLTASDYSVTFSDSDNYTVRSLPDGTTVGTGKLSDNPPKPFDGFQLSLQTPAATPLQAGDSFKVTPTRNAASGITTTMTDPKDIAAAAPLSGTASGANQGNAGFTQPVLNTQANIYNPTATTDLQTALKSHTPVRVVFGAVAADGTQPYSLLDAQGNAVLKQPVPPATTGLPIIGTIVPGQSNTLTFDVGYTDSTGADKTLSISTTVTGSPKANDSLSIGLTAAGSADNRNSTAVLALQTKSTVNIGAAGTGNSMSGAYGALVSSTGSKAAQGKSDVTATTAVVASAKAARDGVSGVSLDEEAANLVKYQQYYTASSQIIKAAQTIFSTLINSL